MDINIRLVESEGKVEAIANLPCGEFIAEEGLKPGIKMSKKRKKKWAFTAKKRCKHCSIKNCPAAKA